MLLITWFAFIVTCLTISAIFAVLAHRESKKTMMRERKWKPGDLFVARRFCGLNAITEQGQAMIPLAEGTIVMYVGKFKETVINGTLGLREQCVPKLFVTSNNKLIKCTQSFRNLEFLIELVHDNKTRLNF